MSPENTPIDDSLFKRIATGDQGAFAELYDLTSGLVYSVAHRILGRPTEAEDVTQEIFLTIWNNAGRFNAELGKPTTWIISLTRNKCIDRLRRLHRRSQVIDESLAFNEEWAVTNDTAKPPSDHDSLRSQLRSALEALPGQQRQLLNLAFFGGLTQQEIATELRLPLGTVKARIRRALLSLRAPLQKLQLETA